MLLSATDADFQDLAAHFAKVPEAQHIIASARESASIYRVLDVYHLQSRRADMIRANFIHFYRSAGDQPKIVAIMGAAHLGLGVTGSGTWDIGTLATSIAALDSRSALRILFFPAGGPHTENHMRKSHPYYFEQDDDSDPKRLFAEIGIDPKRLRGTAGHSSRWHQSAPRCSQEESTRFRAKRDLTS